MFNDRLRKVPFFRLFCPLAAGIAFQSLAEVSHTALTVLSGIACINTFTAYLFCSKTSGMMAVRIFGLSLNICLLLLGASLSVPVRPEPFEPSLMIATVATGPVVKDRTCKLILNQVWLPHDSIPVPGKVMAYLENQGHTITPVPGNRILIFTDLKLVPVPANPYDFNFRTYYSRKKIFYQAFIPSKHWRIIDTATPGSIRLYIESYRYRMGAMIRQLFPRQEENALLNALYLGIKDYLGYEEKSSFSRAGAMHFLAVSGLHTGMVFYILHLVFRWIPGAGKTRTLRTVLIISFLWAYALLTGLSVSVTRACLMLSLWLVASLTRRTSSSFNILFFSAMIILIFNPVMLLDAGFQLSFLAVAGILLFYPHASQIINRTNWLTGRVLSLVLISAAAQLATLPLSMYYFHQVSHYFILTNLLITPLIALLLYAAPLLLVSGFITCPDLPVVNLVSTVTRWILRIIESINRMPGSYSDGYHPGIAQLSLLYLLILSAYIYLFMKRKKYILVILSSVLIYLLIDTCREIVCKNQLQFFVYHIRGTGAINIVSGGENVLLAGTDLADRYEWQAMQHSWDKLGAGDPRIMSGPADSFHLSGDCYICRSPSRMSGLTFIQLRKVRIGIAGRPGPATGGEYHLPYLDYLVVQDNCFPDIKWLAKALPSVILIFDGSNSPAYIRNRMDECRELGITAHNTSEKGYFLLKIPPSDDP